MVVIAFLVATAAVPAGVVGQEAVPASYYGNVEIDGDPAPSGTEIAAVVDGTVHDTITVEEAGTYGGPDAFDEKLVVEQPDTGSSATVEFRVDGVTADQTVEWEDGDVQQVDLTADASGSDGTDGTDGSDGTDGTDGSDGDDTVAGGGGGGGGGGAPDESVSDESSDDSEVEVVQQEEANIETDGEEVRATFDEGDPVEEISFESDVEGSVDVTTTESTPTDVDSTPGAAVQVSEITVPDTARDSPATVRMSVSTARVDARDATADELRVTRLVDGTWESLDTTVAAETADRVVLEAETPGFSYFAVSAVSEPNAVATLSSDTVAVGETVELDGSESTDEHGEITAYEWSLNEETLTGETATTTLDDSGEYAVELTVTNDAGETDTATATLTVGETNGDTDGIDAEAGTDDGELAEEPAGLDLTVIGGLALIALVIGVAVGVAVRRRRGSGNDPLR